jgi:uncharacterized protein
MNRRRSLKIIIQHNKKSDNPRFIVDATLARLAKWLRLLGYDTTIYPEQAGRPMLRVAVDEKRIVLTRRGDMLERQFSGILYLVAGKDIATQLREVLDSFSLPINQDTMFTICLKCNEKLITVTKDDVRDLVPPYVWENCTGYTKCTKCLSIYWAGTHQRNARQSLDKYIKTKI